MSDHHANSGDSIRSYLDQTEDHSWLFDLGSSSIGNYPQRPIAQESHIADFQVAPHGPSLNLGSNKGVYGNGTSGYFSYSGEQQNIIPVPDEIAPTYFNGSFNNAFDAIDTALQPSYPSSNFNFVQGNDESNITSLMAEMSDSISQTTPNTRETLADPTAPLQCTFHNCTNTQIFPSQSALKKHYEKHTRPYICALCNKNFDSNASFQRHKQEVHGSESDAFFCSVRDCKRNRRGFHRRYNLMEHEKKRHGLQPSMSSRRTTCDGSELGGSTGIGDFATARSIREDSSDLDDEEMANDGTKSETTTSPDMRVRLQELRADEHKIQEKIALLEKALLVMEGSQGNF